MASIGDIYLVVRASTKEFEADTVKAAQAAGNKAGDVFGASFEQKAKRALGLALTGVLSLATKGAIDLDNAVRSATAGLGLAADEQARFTSQVSALFKANPTKGYEEIAGTLATLRQEWQLGEADAAKYVQSVLDFSKVTGQDGVTAARGLDDALDAFNLTAADSVKVQDALIGAQRAGAGPAADNLRLLSEVAPALQAANLGWEDAIGLLVSFGDAGVDAAAAPRALQAALSKVKSPEELQQLIEDIRNTEDPFKRSALAADLFGTRAGAKMAQLLKPGSDALKSGKFDVEQFAGATQKGADVIDDSFSNRVTSAIRQVTGTLAEMGPGAATAVTALSGIAQVLYAAGGPIAAFNALKASAIAGWLATLGPAALIAGAGIAFIALVNQVHEVDAAQKDAAISAGDLAGAQAALKREVEATGAWERYDSELDKVQQAQYLQARSAAEAAGATADVADAAGKAAVANDTGATASELAALAAVQQAAAAAKLTGATDTNTVATDTNTDAAINARDAAENQTLATLAGTTAHVQYSNSLGKSAKALLDTGVQAKHLADNLGITTQATKDASTEADYLAEVLAKLPTTVTIDVYQIVHTIQDAVKGAGAEQTFSGGGGVSAAGTINFPAPRRRTGGGGGGSSKADTAAETAAQTKLAAAAIAVKNAFDAALDAQHQKTLRGIQDTLELARTAHSAALQRIADELAVQRAANAAPVTAAEQAQAAIEDARRARDLQEALTDAQSSGDQRRIRDAQEALQSFQAQQQIAALRAQQQTADALAEAAAKQATAVEDARLTAAEAAAAEATKKENEHFDAQKAAFDKAYGVLQDTALKSGKAITLKLAAGILAGIPAVEAAAKKLADAAAAFLPKSPAEKGPFSGDGAPEQRGRRTGIDFGEGLNDELAKIKLTGMDAVTAQLDATQQRYGPTDVAHAVAATPPPAPPPAVTSGSPYLGGRYGNETIKGGYYDENGTFISDRPAPTITPAPTTIIINNPSPEPATRSVGDALKLQAAFG